MSEYHVAYRMRVYAARTVDATEATVLTPAAAAAHSDAFQVASISGVSGYQPYLDGNIRGRRGRIDLLSRRLDVGFLTVMLIDKKIDSDDNLTRWVTAFFGNAQGKPWPRLKVEIDECLDTTASTLTWTRYFTGEITGSRLIEKIGWQLSLAERTEALKMKCFVGTPHSDIDYVAIPTLLPVGIRGADYGPLKVTTPLSGSTGHAAMGGVQYNPGGERAVLISIADRTREDNILTANLMAAAAPHAGGTVTPQVGDDVFGIPYDYSGRCRCHLKRLDTEAEGDFRVGHMFLDEVDGKHYNVVWFYLQELGSSDIGYMADPGDGVSVEVTLYAEEEVTEERPLLIGDVDPATLLEDLCAGKFGQLYRAPMKLGTGKSYGDVMRSVPTADFSAFKDVYPPVRFVIAKPEELIGWVEKNILVPHNWALYLDADGTVNLVDIRLPSSLSGIGTLTDADVDADDDVDWSHDPKEAVLRVDATHYEERIRTPKDLRASPDRFPTLGSSGGIVEETPHRLDPLYIGSIDYGDKVVTVDARGFRSMDGDDAVNLITRAQWNEAALGEVANQIQRPYAYGLTTIPLRCRRTATVTALTPGAAIKVDVDVVPDPATRVRGGEILCRVIEITEDGPNKLLRLVYLGSTSAVDAPTIAAPAQETGNTFTGLTVAVTLNSDSHPVQLRYAVTETSEGTVPADDSGQWANAPVIEGTRGRVTLGLVRSSATVKVRGFPSGKRIWVQGRSLSVDDVLRLPSAWTAAASPGYVDLASNTAPSSLSVDASDRTAVLSWTNGDAKLPTEILIATPTSDPRQRYAIARPGATGYKIFGLDASTEYRVEVRHIVGSGVTSGDTEDFTTDSDTTTAPAVYSLALVAEEDA